MTEVLSKPTDEKLEHERIEYLQESLAAAAIYFCQTLAESKPAPYDDGSQHLPADVYND